MKRHNRGVTLIELMVSITVVGILLGLSVPTFREFTRNNSVTAVQNELVTSFNLARSEALRRNRPVSVCASADGAACGDETTWQTGWLAFTDRGTAGTIDGDDVILQAWQNTNTTLTFLTTGPSYFVQYASTGMSTAAMTIDVSWSDCTGLKKRRVAVTATGAITGRIVDCAAALP